MKAIMMTAEAGGREVPEESRDLTMKRPKGDYLNIAEASRKIEFMY